MNNDYVLYYIPSTNQTIYCYEGSGDNLFEEDREQGLNDYVNYSVMPGRVEPSAFEEDEFYDETVGDGGMYIFNNEDTRYRSMEFAVRMVMKEMMNIDFDTPIEFVGNVEI